MRSATRWAHSLGFKLAAAYGALLLLALALIAVNLRLLDDVRQGAAWLQLSSEGPALVWRLDAQAGRYPGRDPAERQAIVQDLTATSQRIDERFVWLQHGNPQLGFEGALDPAAIAPIQARQQVWQQRVRPLLDELLRAQDEMALRDARERLHAALTPLAERVGEGVEEADAVQAARYQQLRAMQLAFAICVLLVFLAVAMLLRSLTARIGALTRAAAKIAGGALDVRARIPGSDEVASLGDAFDEMTEKLAHTIESERSGRVLLEQTLAEIRETSVRVASASSELFASATQQASGAQQQAAAVYETLSAVDEVTRTSEQAAERARAVAESAQHSEEVGRTGSRNVEEVVSVMETAKTRADSVAESILAFAEQTQAIGEIVSTITEFAEQTNILALNAAIEASRAGEHGKGFAVVASEVKSLADESKKATVQVRRILGEIQRMANRAVLSTEDASKSMNAAMEAARRAGETISALAEVIADVAQSASQISASTGQQATGLSQIQQAIRDINQVASGSLNSVKQVEQAAQDLTSLGNRLRELVESSDGR